MQSLSSAKENRLFVYEVVGLSQNDKTDNLDYSIRKSGSVFLTVPYSRMNQEMRRITRLGARIVSIKPLNVLRKIVEKIIIANICPRSCPHQANQGDF
jgi:phycocyanin-associated rod protein/ferredoxin--NADP+ reductase